MTDETNVVALPRGRPRTPIRTSDLADPIRRTIKSIQDNELPEGEKKVTIRLSAATAKILKLAVERADTSTQAFVEELFEAQGLPATRAGIIEARERMA